MNEGKKYWVYQGTATAVSIVVAIIGIYFLLFATGNTPNSPVVVQRTGTSTPISDYQAKDQMKSTIILKNESNSVSNNVPNRETTVHLNISGSFASGYLDVIANVQGKPLETDNPEKFDDVFLDLIQLTPTGTNSDLGGHLIEDKSLPTPSSSTSTEMLFKLSDVPYQPIYSESSLVSDDGNWLEAFNDDRYSKEIISFLSTVKGVGAIDSVTFYYTCAEGSNCSIAAD